MLNKWALGVIEHRNENADRKCLLVACSRLIIIEWLERDL